MTKMLSGIGCNLEIEHSATLAYKGTVALVAPVVALVAPVLAPIVAPVVALVVPGPVQNSLYNDPAHNAEQKILNTNITDLTIQDIEALLENNSIKRRIDNVIEFDGVDWGHHRAACMILGNLEAKHGYHFNNIVSQTDFDMIDILNDCICGYNNVIEGCRTYRQYENMRQEERRREERRRRHEEERRRRHEEERRLRHEEERRRRREEERRRRHEEERRRRHEEERIRRHEEERKERRRGEVDRYRRK